MVGQTVARIEEGNFTVVNLATCFGIENTALVASRQDQTRWPPVILFRSGVTAMIKQHHPARWRCVSPQTSPPPRVVQPHLRVMPQAQPGLIEAAPANETN